MSDLVPVNMSGRPPVPEFRPYSSPGASPASSDEETVTLQEIIGVVRRHIWLLLGITVVVLAIGAFAISRQERMYRAMSVIRLKDERGALTGGIEANPADQLLGKATDPILSALQVLQSRTVSADVVRRSGIRVRPLAPLTPVVFNDVDVAPEVWNDTIHVAFSAANYVARNRTATARAAYGQPVQVGGTRFTVPAKPPVDRVDVLVLPEQGAISYVQSGLKARVRERTDVIELEFTSTIPREAQQIVNVAVEAFQEQNAKAAQDQSRRRRVFIEEQLHAADSMLATAQGQLSAFRQQHQAFSTRGKFEAQQSALMGLDVRREELAAERQMYGKLLTRLSQAQGATSVTDLQALVSMPGVSENAIVTQLYGQLVQYQSMRDTMIASGRAPNGPDVTRVRALIGATQRNLVEAVRSHATSVDARLAALDQLKARSASEMQALPASESQETQMGERLETVRRMADQLREEYQKSRIAEAVEAGQVTIVDPASRPTQPVGTGRGPKLAMALVLGLLLGTAASFLAERLNTSVRSREDVERLLRVPGLAIIPRMGDPVSARRRLSAVFGNKAIQVHGTNEASPSLVTASDVRAVGAEAFRTLRTNLIFSATVQRIRRLVITSTAAGEGKTTVASNLAVTMAQQGMNVLIIDCDLRRPRLHAQFGVPREPGLTQLVLGFSSIEETIRPTGVERLSILACGTLPPNPSELLGGTRLAELLADLGERFDMVIIDSPPLMAAADAAILGKYSDGVLMVIRAGSTSRAMIQHSREQLAAVGARVLGAVLNDPDAELPKYDAYYAYQYQYGGYSEDSATAGKA